MEDENSNFFQIQFQREDLKHLINVLRQGTSKILNEPPIGLLTAEMKSCREIAEHIEQWCYQFGELNNVQAQPGKVKGYGEKIEEPEFKTYREKIDRLVKLIKSVYHNIGYGNTITACVKFSEQYFEPAMGYDEIVRIVTNYKNSL